MHAEVGHRHIQAEPSESQMPQDGNTPGEPISKDMNENIDGKSSKLSLQNHRDAKDKHWSLEQMGIKGLVYKLNGTIILLTMGLEPITH